MEKKFKLASEIQVGEVIKMNSISGLLFDDFRVESIENDGEIIIFRGDTICCKNQPYKRYANKMIEVLDRPSTFDQIKLIRANKINTKNGN